MIFLTIFIYSSGWPIDLSTREIYETPLIAVGDDAVCIARPGDSRLIFFDRNGKYLSTQGRKGKGPGEIADLQTLTWDASSKAFLVYDSATSQLSSFTPAGFITSQKISQLFGEIYFDGYFGKTQRFFWVDHEAQAISRVDAVSGQKTPIWRSPEKVESGFVFEMNGHKNKIQYKWDPKILFSAHGENAAVCLNANQLITLMGSGKSKNVTFNAQLKRFEVTEQDYNDALNSMPPFLKSQLASKLKKPDFWPAISAIEVTNRDVWVFGYPIRGQIEAARYSLAGKHLETTAFNGVSATPAGDHFFVIAMEDEKPVLTREDI